MEKIELTIPFEVICIDAKDRPESIPTSKWLEEGKVYTVIKVAKLMVQEGIIGFKLAELNIDDCFPYQFFAANRFGIVIEESYNIEEELDRLLKEAKEEYENTRFYEKNKIN
jgi:hypothetical protein